MVPSPTKDRHEADSRFGRDFKPLTPLVRYPFSEKSPCLEGVVSTSVTEDVVTGIHYGRNGVLLVETRDGQFKTPGGKVEKGETREAALARELREEAGVEIVEMHGLLYRVNYQEPGVIRRIEMYEIVTTGTPAAHSKDPDNDIQHAAFYPTSQALELLSRGRNRHVSEPLRALLAGRSRHAVWHYDAAHNPADRLSYWAKLSKFHGIVLGHWAVENGLLHTDQFVVPASVLSDAHQGHCLAEGLAEILRSYQPTVILGPETGGIDVASRVGPLLGIPYATLRKHGTVRNGHAIRPGDRIAVVDNTFFSGKTLQFAIEAIESITGIQPVVAAVIAVIEGCEKKNNFPIPIHSLTSVAPRYFRADKCPMCAPRKSAAVLESSRKEIGE